MGSTYQRVYDRTVYTRIVPIFIGFQRSTFNKSFDVNVLQPPEGAYLSPREREVHSYIAQGKSNSLIAEEMGVKPKTVNQHVRAIRAALRLDGGGWRVKAAMMDTKYLENQPARPNGLSKREFEVLGYAAQGLSNRAIASTLHITPRTVEHHTSSILDKLHISPGGSSRVKAIQKYAEESGYRFPKEAVRPHEPLTPQQRRTLSAIARGDSNSKIAADLGIVPRTVEHHITDLAGRLNIYDYGNVNPKVMLSLIGDYVLGEKPPESPIRRGVITGTELRYDGIGHWFELMSMPGETGDIMRTEVPYIYAKDMRLEPPLRHLTSGVYDGPDLSAVQRIQQLGSFLRRVEALYDGIPPYVTEGILTMFRYPVSNYWNAFLNATKNGYPAEKLVGLLKGVAGKESHVAEQVFKGYGISILQTASSSPSRAA